MPSAKSLPVMTRLTLIGHLHGADDAREAQPFEPGRFYQRGIFSGRRPADTSY